MWVELPGLRRAATHARDLANGYFIEIVGLLGSFFEDNGKTAVKVNNFFCITLYNCLSSIFSIFSYFVLFTPFAGFGQQSRIDQHLPEAQRSSGDHH